MGSTTFGYHATISNGRGPTDSYRDKDSNKALGGRIYAAARPFGELQIGASIYRGRYTEYKARLAATAATPPSVTVERTPYVGIEELSMAADLR